MVSKKKPELMAPAGDWTMLTAAVNSGADAVYFGIEKLNMRIKADNFSFEDLPEVIKFCKKNKVHTYLTLNSIVYENEISLLDEILLKIKEMGIDAVICWDFAVIEKCREYNVPFCISTQASISNSASTAFFKNLGAKRIVLARECTLKQIEEIRKSTDIEIETFVHGAMCIAISGRCLLSHHIFGKSANRGECLQPCRREYEVYDDTIGKSLLIGDDFVLSPKDLCTIEFLDKLIEAGIDSFKIEGRKRSPEYVSKTVSVYRRGIDLYFDGKLIKETKKDLLKELEEVYNRGFSSGFYFGTPGSEDYAGFEGSKATKKKKYIGRVLNYYKKAKAAYILLEAGELNLKDEIMIMGPTTGVLNLSIENILIDEISSHKAFKGTKLTFPCPELIRPADKVYLIYSVEE